jgi:hypothetical protein
MLFREHMLYTMSCTTCTTIWRGNTSINDTSNCLSSSVKTTHTLGDSNPQKENQDFGLNT